MAKYTTTGRRVSLKDGSTVKYLRTYTQPRLIHLFGRLYHRYHSAVYPLLRIVDKAQIYNYRVQLNKDISEGKLGLPLDGSEVFMPITNRQDATCFHLRELFVKNISEEQIL